jgi:hypothetical protein
VKKAGGYLTLTVHENVECGGGGKGLRDTRTSFIYFDHPTHVCESNCSEATNGTGADHDKFFCHGESASGSSFAGMA